MQVEVRRQQRKPETEGARGLLWGLLQNSCGVDAMEFISLGACQRVFFTIY